MHVTFTSPAVSTENSEHSLNDWEYSVMQNYRGQQSSYVATPKPEHDCITLKKLSFKKTSQNLAH